MCVCVCVLACNAMPKGCVCVCARTCVKRNARGSEQMLSNIKNTQSVCKQSIKSSGKNIPASLDALTTPSVVVRHDLLINTHGIFALTDGKQMAHVCRSLVLCVQRNAKGNEQKLHSVKKT